MGLLSKLREVFGGKSIETFQELENDLEKLNKKYNSKLIAFIGTGSKIKGLPLIYVVEDERDIREFSAKFPELLKPLNNLSNSNKIQDVSINYEEEILYFKPILKNISFVTIYKQKNDIFFIKQWINNKLLVIKNIFHEEE